MNGSRKVAVSGGFDDIRSRALRFLDEASKLGELTVLLWPDQMLERINGHAPQFPLAERLYFLKAVRYINRVIVLPQNAAPDTLPELNDFQPDLWLNEESMETPARREFCRKTGLEFQVLPAAQLSSFPSLERDCLPRHSATTAGAESQSQPTTASDHKKVIVTGSFDWFHSGHVRFLEEAAGYGDLYVVVGHDANIRLLKGPGHPLFPEAERRYAVASIKFVKQALVSTGTGWLDADPEIQRLKPDFYVVNEDGDRGNKREYCSKMGISYIVLKRVPAPGLPGRSSTKLRGF